MLHIMPKHIMIHMFLSVRKTRRAGTMNIL